MNFVNIPFKMMSKDYEDFNIDCQVERSPVLELFKTGATLAVCGMIVIGFVAFVYFSLMAYNHHFTFFS